MNRSLIAARPLTMDDRLCVVRVADDESITRAAHAELIAAVRCCDEFPECSHVLAHFESPGGAEMTQQNFRWTDGVATAPLRSALTAVENERRSWAERAERIEALQMAERIDPLSSRHEEREYAEGVQFGLDLAAKLLRESADTLRYVGEQMDARWPQEPTS